MQKYNLLRTLALTGICCASINSVMAKNIELPKVAVPTVEIVKKAAAQVMSEWEKPDPHMHLWVRQGKARLEAGGITWEVTAVVAKKLDHKPKHEKGLEDYNVQLPPTQNNISGPDNGPATLAAHYEISPTMGKMNDIERLMTSLTVASVEEYTEGHCKAVFEPSNFIGWENCP